MFARARWYLFFVAAWCVLPRTAVAQSAVDSTALLWRSIGLTALPNLDTLAANARYQPSRVTLDFEHLLSLYNWGASVHYTSPHVSETSAFASVDAEGRSRLQQESQTLTSEASVVMNADLPITSIAPIGAFASLFGTSYAVTSSDVRAAQTAGLITNVLDGYGIAGASYGKPNDPMYLRIGAGIARQSVQPDHSYGTILRGDALAMPSAIADGQTLEWSATMDERFFPMQVERRSDDKLHALVLSAVSGNGVNELTANASFSQRSFYFTVDSSSGNIRQQRRELTALLSDALHYPIVSKSLVADLSLSYEPRIVTRTLGSIVPAALTSNAASLSSLLAPNDVSGSRIVGEAKLSLANGGANASGFLWQAFTGSTLIHYEERDENVTLRSSELVGIDATTLRRLADELDLASYSSKLTQALATLGWQLDPLSVLTVEGSARILRYDTPDPANHDDRDELVASARAQYAHAFTRELASTLELRLSRTHLVYLASDRSAQNAVTKTIGLYTRSQYVHRPLAAALNADVFADYTVLDYADQLPSLADGSYLLRGSDFSDSVIIGIGKMTEALESNIATTSQLTIFERGEYNAPAFSERANARTVELTTELTFGLRSTYEEPFEFRLGARGFFLRRSGVDPTALTNPSLSELQRLDRIGPIASIAIIRSGATGGQIYGEIWYGIVRSSNGANTPVDASTQIESHLSVDWVF